MSYQEQQFTEAAGAAHIDQMYAKARVELADELARDSILALLQPTGAKINLDDLRRLLAPETQGGLKRGCSMYFATLENHLGGLIQHSLMHDTALSFVQNMFDKCGETVRAFDRMLKRADLDSNADDDNPVSLPRLGTRVDTLLTELGTAQAEIDALKTANTPADLQANVQNLQQQVQELKNTVATDVTELRELVRDLRRELDELNDYDDHPPSQMDDMEHEQAGDNVEQLDGAGGNVNRNLEAPQGPQQPPIDPERIPNGPQGAGAPPPPPPVYPGAGDNGANQHGPPPAPPPRDHGHQAGPPPPPHQGAGAPPPPPPGPPGAGDGGANQWAPPPPPPRAQGQQAMAPPPPHQAPPAPGLAAGVGQALRGAKCPKLESIDPSRFEEFVFNYEVFAESERWDEHTKKVNAILSLSGKASEHLRLIVPNWRQPQVTLRHMFAAWTRRVLPQAQVDVAIKHVATIQQHLDEPFDDYILRGTGMHRFAYSMRPDHVEAERNTDFIVRLTNGLLDRNIRAHVERAKPETITAMREIIHREAAIAHDPSNRNVTMGINAMEVDGVNAIDPSKSHSKPLPPCEICNNKMHATAGCALLPKYKQMYKREQDHKRQRRGNLRRGQGGRGRDRGRDRGRGRGQPRSNSADRQWNDRQPRPADPKIKEEPTTSAAPKN